MSGREQPIGAIGQRFADEIRYRREHYGMSFAELSRRLIQIGHPIPPLGLRRIETYDRRVDIDDLDSIAQVLDIDVAQMPWTTND